MTDRGRWASQAHPLVGRHAGLGCSRMPRGSAGTARQCVMGRLLRSGCGQKEQGSPVCSTRDQRHLSGERTLPNRGVRESLCRAGCHATPGDRTVRCDYNEAVSQECGNSPSACAGREVSLRRATASSQASLNSSCQKNRRKQFSSRTTLHIACRAVVNAFQQYERLARLATAKFERR